MNRETEALAALLRELKERSGRSYGALGKRLHVSTSTVHRYCNGTAVPADYAPLERLARHCGATAEELVELHRRWILADASRRREPEPPEGAVSRSADGGKNVAAVTPPGDPAGKSGRPEEGSPGREHSTGHGDERDPEAARPERSSDREAAASEPGREPRFPRRTWLLAAAVTVAAVTVSTAVFAAGHRASPARHPVSGASKGGSAAPAPPATSTGTGTRTTATGSATPAAAGHPSPPRSPAVRASPPGAAAASPPIHVNVLANHWATPCAQWFLLNRAPGTVPPPPVSQATDGWAAALGAVPAGHLRLQVTVQGSSAQPVVLHALYVRVTGARKAPTGNAYVMGAGCGGDLAPASFAVNLDDQAPSPKAVPGHRGNITTRATDFPYKVSAADPEVLNVDAATATQDVDWYLELSWSSGDRQGTTRIDDHGRPFRTAGIHGVKEYWYNADGTNAWTPYPS